MMALISHFAIENNLIWGVCDSRALVEFEPTLNGRQTPFVSQNTAVRLDPKRTMEQVKSIVVVGLGYDHVADFEPDNQLRGALSVGAVGVDYHVKMKALLQSLVFEMTTWQPFDSQIFVDNGPLVERALAHKAGLGAYGKNCNLISEKFGSFFNIGYVLTDLKLPASVPQKLMADACAHCTLCIEACPGGALSHGEVPTCDAAVCVSYLTQKKGELTAKEKKTMGIMLYGCDVCQRVCPANQHKKATPVTVIDQLYPRLDELMSLSNKEFSTRFGHTAAGWRGKKTIVRNAEIAAKNQSLYKRQLNWKK